MGEKKDDKFFQRVSLAWLAQDFGSNVDSQVWTVLKLATATSFALRHIRGVAGMCWTPAGLPIVSTIHAKVAPCTVHVH